MSLKLYNSATSQKEDFKSISPNQVLMYCCGPTVYDAPHLGNFRTFVFYDLVKRVLTQNNFKVKQVVNITDIDDKIIDKVNSGEMDYKELTTKFNDVFLQHSKTLSIEKADEYPKTSDYVPAMIDFIKQLIDKGYAYNANGNIFFDTEGYSRYGKFINMENTEVLDDEDNALGKKNQKDFTLWKAWKEEDGDITWESEWGNGRPAWHTECAVLATKSLGNAIDIHCGGIDLKFPHHEN
ncbi:MAG: cysteine--tRNA ligase, partial [Candidatus Neomarinimicrobiota bacterium]|nr:cysteine--tRNA ligase [Candidatus Neomarinimicrobiota bacterium]